MARPPLAARRSTARSPSRRKRGQWVARCRFRDLDGVTRQRRACGPVEDRRPAGPPGRAAHPARRAHRGAPSRVPVPRRGRHLDGQDPRAPRATRPPTPTRAASTTRSSRSSASCASSSATSPTSTPSSPAWSGPARSSSRPTARPSRSPSYAANTRRMIRAIVSGVLQQAVLHQAVATNPVRDLERIESPKGHRKAPPRGLTAEERRRLLAFVDTDKTADPRRPARPDPLRPRLRPAHRRDLRGALDGPRPRRHPGRQRDRHAPGAGRRRPAERLPGQGQGPRRARRQDRRPPCGSCRYRSSS